MVLAAINSWSQILWHSQSSEFAVNAARSRSKCRNLKTIDHAAIRFFLRLGCIIQTLKNHCWTRAHVCTTASPYVQLDKGKKNTNKTFDNTFSQASLVTKFILRYDHVHDTFKPRSSHTPVQQALSTMQIHHKIIDSRQDRYIAPAQPKIIAATFATIPGRYVPLNPEQWFGRSLQTGICRVVDCMNRVATLYPHIKICMSRKSSLHLFAVHCYTLQEKETAIRYYRWVPERLIFPRVARLVQLARCPWLASWNFPIRLLRIPPSPALFHRHITCPSSWCTRFRYRSYQLQQSSLSQHSTKAQHCNLCNIPLELI